MKRRLAFTATLAAIASSSALASAQVSADRPSESGDQNYVFKDDLLNSDVGGPGGGTIVVRPSAARTMLIQPRTSFVVEMFKSVEHI